MVFDLDRLVSIIIPVFNSGKFLPETLDSVKKQTYNNIEVVIIDNGSDDKLTVELLNQLESEYKVLSSKKRGVSNARNQAIEEAKGEYILPLDSDDCLKPNFIEKCMEAFQNEEEISVVRTQVELFGKKSGKLTLAPYSYEVLLARNLMVVTSMFRKKDWEKIGGFDESFERGFEDWEFWINLLQENGKVFTIDDALFQYRIRKGSRNHSLKEKDFEEARKLIWEKHKTQYGRYFVNPKESFEYKLIEESKANKLGNLLLAPFSSLKLMQQ